VGKAKTKTKLKYFWLIPCLLMWFFILPKISLASDKNVVINEIYCDGDNDWIELYNNTSKSIDLAEKNYRIEKTETAKDPSILMRIGNSGDGNYAGKTIIPDKGYYLIVRDEASDELKNIADAIGTKNEFTWGCSGYTFYLGTDAISNDSDEDIVDEVSYGYSDDKANFCKENQSPEIGNKESIERNNKSDNSENKCSELKKNNDPTPTNSQGATLEKPKPKEYSKEIRLNELLPDPNEGEKEFIEIYNPKEENLEGLAVKDKSGKKCEISDKIAKNKFIVLWDCGIKLNNTTEEKVYLYDPNDEENPLDQTSYSKSEGKNISYSFDGTGWKWSHTPTPGEENKFDKELRVEIGRDKKAYQNMYANFEADVEEKGEFKFVWDFGDGHKSYLQKNKHKYKKAKTYQASLQVKGSKSGFFKTFSVKVEKFGKSEVKIVGVKANPKGKDTGFESITIKNNSKKRINLKGWSIATGWENLYNHPITKKLILKAGEKKNINRDYSYFSLNNKQTRIELRYPDGKAASRVKYSKSEGVQEDEIYEKTENGWEWKGGMESKVKNDENNFEIDSSNSEGAPASAEAASADKEENIGKRSVEENVKIKLASYGAETKQIFEIQEKVLGASTMKDVLIGDYQKKQRGVKPFEYLFFLINFQLNKLIDWLGEI
jgi:hypothetical protein